jgi:hypothetical protein
MYVHCGQCNSGRLGQGRRCLPFQHLRLLHCTTRTCHWLLQCFPLPQFSGNCDRVLWTCPWYSLPWPRGLRDGGISYWGLCQIADWTNQETRQTVTCSAGLQPLLLEGAVPVLRASQCHPPVPERRPGRVTDCSASPGLILY